MKGPSRLQTVVVAPQEKVAVVITLYCRSVCCLLLAARLLLGCCCSQEQPTPHQPNTVFGSVCRLQSFLSIEILVRICFSAKSLHSKRLSPPQALTMPCMFMAHGQVGQTCMVSLALWGFSSFPLTLYLRICLNYCPLNFGCVGTCTAVKCSQNGSTYLPHSSPFSSRMVLRPNVGWSFTRI